jgi:hypothetical protein
MFMYTQSHNEHNELRTYMYSNIPWNKQKNISERNCTADHVLQQENNGKNRANKVMLVLLRKDMTPGGIIAKIRISRSVRSNVPDCALCSYLYGHYFLESPPPLWFLRCLCGYYEARNRFGTGKKYVLYRILHRCRIIHIARYAL